MKRITSRLNATGRLCGMALFCLLFGMPLYAEGPPPRSLGQDVYIPIYSHIYGGDREHRIDLAATLSIRNTDPQQPIAILAVDYYDTGGKLQKHYLDAPRRLPPLASVRFVVKESDKTGGSGANFIVRWSADKPVNPPLIESVMIGTRAQLGISFTSRGQVLSTDGN